LIEEHKELSQIKTSELEEKAKEMQKKRRMDELKTKELEDQIKRLRKQLAKVKSRQNGQKGKSSQ